MVVDHGVDGEAFGDVGLALLSQSFRESGVGGEALDRVGEGLIVVGGEQEAVSLVVHDFGRAADIGGDHRLAGGHGLQDSVGHAFAMGREA